MKKFQYEFTVSTKKDIDNYAVSQASRIKEYYNNGKLKIMLYHFKQLR